MLLPASGRSGGQGADNVAVSGGGTGDSRSGAVDGAAQAVTDAESRIKIAGLTAQFLCDRGLNEAAGRLNGGAGTRGVSVGGGEPVGQARFAVPSGAGQHAGSDEARLLGIPVGAGIALMVDPPDRTEERKRDANMGQKAKENEGHVKAP